MHRNRNPCNSFLIVKMASGMDHGRVRPTTTTTTNDVAQHGGHLANTKSCSLGLQPGAGQKTSQIFVYASSNEK